MKKIIALDIDQFRVGVYGSNYEEVFSSVYSDVKKNTWKPSFFNNHIKEVEGSEIELEEASNTIFWGIKRRQSRRSKAYHTFGDALNNVEDSNTIQLVRTVLSYLAGNRREMFEEVNDHQLSCSICIGVSSESADELKKMADKFEGEYSALVDGVEFSIVVEEAVLVPKSFCSLLESDGRHFESDKHKVQAFDGLNYIIDVNDHYVKCDVYDNGELIKSENISHGIYDFSDRIVQEYKTNCVQNNQRAFQIDRDKVYSIITNSESILVVNGRQQIDLTNVINEEITAETKKVLSYLTKDNDVQYADTIIIRDLKKGIINQSIVDQYLESFGMHCINLDNKGAKGIYTFGTIFLGDNFLNDNEEAHETQSESFLRTPNSEMVEENNAMEEDSSVSLGFEMEAAIESEEQVTASEHNDFLENELTTAVVDSIQEEQLAKTSNEIEIEDILKEQDELLSSLVGFEDDSL